MHGTRNAFQPMRSAVGSPTTMDRSVTASIPGNDAPGDESDYSSDSSLEASPMTQRQADAEAGRRVRRAGQQNLGTTDTSDATSFTRHTLLGQPYRFTDGHCRAAPAREEVVGVAATDEERVELAHLRGLVHYGPLDLLTHTWNLLPTSQKVRAYPPFSVLPNCPNILEVRAACTDEVSKFMCQATLDLVERRPAISPVRWRALLVRSAVHNEALRLGQGSGAQLPLPDSLLDPAWETDTEPHARLDCDAAVDGPGEVGAIDVSAALAMSHFAEGRAPLRTLALLHQVVNRCVQTGDLALLGSWGVLHISAVLLHQIDAAVSGTDVAPETLPEAERVWLGVAVGLAYKIAVVASSTDQLLALLRFSVRHPRCAAAVQPAGTAALLAAMEDADIGRVRLHLPAHNTKGVSIALGHALDDASVTSVTAVCVAGQEPDLSMLALTDQGLLRVPLRAPYVVEARNAELTSATASGLVLAVDGCSLSCAVLRPGKPPAVAVLDPVTLAVTRELSVTALAADRAPPTLTPAGFATRAKGDAEELLVHVGDGRFVTPHYECSRFGSDTRHAPAMATPSSSSSSSSTGSTSSGRAPNRPVRYATFTTAGGRTIRGDMSPAGALETLPHESHSLSVQFYLRPLPTVVSSSLSILSVTLSNGRTWLNAEVHLLPASGTMRLVFTHGTDAVAEVEEPLPSASSSGGGGAGGGAASMQEWVLWSATLASINDVASWSVYRNGTPCDAKCRSGPLVTPGAHTAELYLLHGTFSGQLAVVQAWSRAQNAADMRVAATEGVGRKTQGLLTNFPLDEGVGCCLHCQERGRTWLGTGVAWAPARQPLPVRGTGASSPQEAPRRVGWHPQQRSGSGAPYRVTSNGFETLLLHDHSVATWVDRNGRVVEQSMVRLDPEVDLPCYCPVNNKLYVLSLRDSPVLRALPLPGLSSASVSKLESVATARPFYDDVLARCATSAAPAPAGAGAPVNVMDVAEFVARKMCGRIVSESDMDVGSGNNTGSTGIVAALSEDEHKVLALADTWQLSVRSMARLLSLSEELAASVRTRLSQHGGSSGEPVADGGGRFEVLLLCLCGRLLVRQMRLVERQCPAKVVLSMVEIHRFLQTAPAASGAAGGLRGVFEEARGVFAHLHRVVLAECVSHDYQLRLITESADLKDVRQLLAAENLPPLVSSVIAKDLSKPFMTFLHRLKEHCQAEAVCILEGNVSDFNASDAMLIVLLGMLSQQEKVQWHLIAVAVVESLTKTVVQSFQKRFPSAAEQQQNVSALKRTALGVVVYPVVHYLYDMKLDVAIAARATRALNQTRLLLSALKPKTGEQRRPSATAAETFTLNEVHTLATPSQHSGKFTAVFHLQHASRVTVAVTNSISGGGDADGLVVVAGDVSLPGCLHVSLIDNNYARHSFSLNEGECAFPCGGRLLVECGRRPSAGRGGSSIATNVAHTTTNPTNAASLANPRTATGGLVGDGGGDEDDEDGDGASAVVFSLVITARVDVPMEDTDWLADTCLALSQTVVNTTQRNLLAHLPQSHFLSPEPFLRGGLSRNKLCAGAGAGPAGPATTLGVVGADVDEEGVEVQRQLCCIAEMEPNGMLPGSEDSLEAKLYKGWLDVFRSKHFPYADRLERTVRWASCAMVWHQLKPSTAGGVGTSAPADPAAVTTILEKELSKALDWLKRKSFLLLEAHQQGRSTDIVERSRFLLKDVNPRCRAEALLAEAQHTEEPIEAGLAGGGAAHTAECSRSGLHGRPGGCVASYSLGQRSRHNTNSSSTMSYRRLGVGGAETLDMMTSSSRYGASRMATRGGGASAAAVRLFSSGLKPEVDSLPDLLFAFLVNGSKDGSTDDIAAHLYTRVTQAAAHTAAFKLQEELCAAYAANSDVVASILLSHLRYRTHAAAAADMGGSQQPAAAGRPLSAAATARGGAGGGSGFGQHYMENLVGCGLARELELQKAACAFVQSALRIVVHKLDACHFGTRGSVHLAEKVFPVTEALALCAVLCHPWDSVDMSLLDPQRVFYFLRRLLSTVLVRRLESAVAGDGAQQYEESKGLFDLFHRCLIVPNSLLQVTVEGVRVAEAEVQGMHVENANVVCCARNHWRALSAHGRVPPRRGVESDLFANYGLPCVVTELPDVLYFEITLDLFVDSTAFVSLGLSSLSLSPVETVDDGKNVRFLSDGSVHFAGEPPTRFSDPWQEGDVIGCGLFAPTSSIFFTRNGQFLGAAGASPFMTLVPFVAVKAASSLLKVIVNFGEQMPFKYDLASLHCSCRRRYLSSATLCDAAYTTVHYLITQCYTNLAAMETDPTPATNRDAVSGLLERATSFLNDTILELVDLYRKQSTKNRTVGQAAQPGLGTAEAGAGAAASAAVGDGSEAVADALEEPLAVMISRLFHCVTLVIECFEFDAVTSRTHAKVLQVCALTLTGSHDKWVKVRAAECLGRVRQVMREDYLAEATEAFKRIVPAEELVHHLVELARAKLVKETEAPPPPPKWVGGTRVVRGKGVFFGSAPVPKKGTYMVGFRIRRRHQAGQGTGAPLGGCYYLGLSHGQPAITSMNNLIARPDVYVLQDTDDQDQVPHLLLKRQSIPRNAHRRIFGNDEVVWVQFNADQGEITFFRENMILIGLAFANITKTDDLYPVVYHFNDDASCEIVPPPVSGEESAEQLTEKLRRSVAVRTLQQLHLVGYFASVISQFIHRAITQLDRGLESCLVALSVLGGERSYLFCQHDTHGLVVVHAIADVSRKAVVYLANDEERHLLSVDPSTLKPSFVQTPLYASGSPEADACASLLMTELNRSLYDASVVAPLVRLERVGRQRIEDEYAQATEDATTLDLMGLLSLVISSRGEKAAAGHNGAPLLPAAGAGVAAADSDDEWPSDLTRTHIDYFGYSTPTEPHEPQRPAAKPYNSYGARTMTRSLAGYGSTSEMDAHLSNDVEAAASAASAALPTPSQAIPIKQSSSRSITTEQAVVVDRQHSSRSLYTPNPSIGVTTNSRGCCTIRASAVFEQKWTLSIALAQLPAALVGSGTAAPGASVGGGTNTSHAGGAASAASAAAAATAGSAAGGGGASGGRGGAAGGAGVGPAAAASLSLNEHTDSTLLYVGVTSSVDTYAEHVDDVQSWADAWALCNVDSSTTNNVNCSIEPNSISSADAVLFGSCDILILEVDRPGGTVAFSRVRRGKLVRFGVLCEGVAEDEVLRPFVVCGPDTVAVFSFLGGTVFPARNTFPISNFSVPTGTRKPVDCSVCGARLCAPCYGGMDDVMLCDFCFKSWQCPKDLFYVTGGGSPSSASAKAPLYIVSTRVPEMLSVGSFVEFEESGVPAWSARKSVNVETSNATAAVSVFEEAFAVTEPLPLYGTARVDVLISHVAGVAGCPFSGLLPFVPLWRDEQQTHTTCVVQSESLVISASIIPANTKTLFSIRVSEAKSNQSVALTGVFAGVTNMSDTTYTVTRADLDRLCANNNVWGSWCDTKDKVSTAGTMYILVDTILGTILLSSTLGGLFRNPFVITCSVSLHTGKEESLRLVLFSHETCRVTSAEGLTSCNELAEPSFAPVAVGLVPDDAFGCPDRNVFDESVVVMDTIQQTRFLSEAARSPGRWDYTRHAVTGCNGVLFTIDDTVTLVLERDAADIPGEQRRRQTGGATVKLYCQGTLVATRALTREEAGRRYRFAVYLSARGLTAAFVPPVFGRTHLGRVLAVHGPEVCVVEARPDPGSNARKRFAVRRRDVRYCALAASELPNLEVALRDGARVAFRIAPIQPPKRGSVVSFSGSTAMVSEGDSDRSTTALTPEQCFVLANEGQQLARQVLYPLVTPPTSTITKLFEVGKTKYRLHGKNSYNGIVFDCKTSETIELIGLSLLSLTTGRHKAEVFFKKGTYRNHERDPRSWTTLFSGYVDMQVDRYFSITFAGVCIDAGSTFAIYVNTSHNCGVGFYSEEDGFQGEVGAEMDDDGTITVMLGRKSGSATAFGDFSVTPRGFCGTIMYKKNKGSKPPLIEGERCSTVGLVGGTGTGMGTGTGTGAAGGRGGSAGDVSVPFAAPAGSGITGEPGAGVSSPAPAPQLTTVADVNAKQAFAALNGDVLKLISRPVHTKVAPCVWFTVEVPKTPVRVESLRLPVIFESWADSLASHGRGGGSVTPFSQQPLQNFPECYGLMHCVVSLLFCPLPAPKGGEGGPSSQLRAAAGDTPQMAVAASTVGQEHSDDCGATVPAGSAEWSWAWNSRVLIDASATEVEVRGLDIHLSPGRYCFVAGVRDLLGEHADDCSLQLAHAADPGYAKSNALVTVRGFYGDMVVEADAPTLMGELHTMTTGAFLNQSNSASYNGIMFDLRSKQDITLEEVFCVSQTSADNASVRLFWKEGSMEGAEKSPLQWREVAARDMQLVDKQPFSVGSVVLRMKANQVYSLFINTSSSCGVRFYNSSDGHVGFIGDEFENDGVVTVYVGRKSESSSPFAEIPMEPRAFRGRLIYRTYASNNPELLNHAMFSYYRAFIVTRMLVALSSYVDTSASSPPSAAAAVATGHPAQVSLTAAGGAAATPRFSYEGLLAVVATLATSPCQSITDLMGAENVLSAILKKSAPDELRSGVVSVPLAPERVAFVAAVSAGDLALVIDDAHSVSAGLSAGQCSVALVNAVSEDESTATVTLLAGGVMPAPTSSAAAKRVGPTNKAGAQTAGGALHRTVPVKCLLPLARCWQCQHPHATTEVCPATGLPHRPPTDEKERVAAAIASVIMQKHTVGSLEAMALATSVLHNPTVNILDAVAHRPRDTSVTGATGKAPLRLRSRKLTRRLPMRAVGSGCTSGTASRSCSLSAVFSVPAAMLLPEQESYDEQPFTCPFVYCEEIGAYVSLRVSPTVRGVTVDFITDRPLLGVTRADSGAQEQEAMICVQEGAYRLQLYAVQEPNPLMAAAAGNREEVSVADGSDRDTLLNDTAAVALLASPFLYIASGLGRFVEPILAKPLTASTCSFFTRAGVVHLLLSVQRVPLPPPTPVIRPLVNPWCWEGGAVEAQLSSSAPTYLGGVFTREAWPELKPRFCSLMMVSKGKDKTVFLEAHVNCEVRRGPGLWESAPRTTSKTLVRKPLNLASGEVVTLGFSTDGDFFICDAEDVIRCRISANELTVATRSTKETVRQRIGFVSVGQDKVTAQLAPIEYGRCTTRPQYLPEIRSDVRKDDTYEPLWQRFDAQCVTVSRNNAVAGCCSDEGGQAVLGTLMPATGVSAFVLQIDRHDKASGSPLGSGHFAGVAVSDFSSTAPRYKEMKRFADAVWAVQDVQDEDSLTNQAPIPPLECDGDVSSNALFCCSTRLLFIVDRAAGTLLLARDDESPRIIFHDIPSDIDLCPFVRLDHTHAYAALSRFSHKNAVSYARALYQPSLERAALLQPITSSFLRRFPFAIILKLFPAVMQMVNQLPSTKASRLEKHWSDVGVHSRFQYRLARALDRLVELGAFARDMIECDQARVDALFAKPSMADVIRSLAVIPEAEVAVLPLGARYQQPSLPPLQLVPSAAAQSCASPSTPVSLYRTSPRSLSRSPTDLGLAPEDAMYRLDSTQDDAHYPPLQQQQQQRHRRTLSLLSGFGGGSGGGGGSAAQETYGETEEVLGSAELLAGQDTGSGRNAYFRVPAEYEVVGRVPGTSMLRLMYMDRVNGPMERTLHLVRLDAPTCAMRLTNEVLPHPSAMQQCEVLAPLNGEAVCGVIAEGWFDCTLEELWAAARAGSRKAARALSATEERKIAAALLCGVEHWHLHGFPHGHVVPANVYVRVVNGTVAQCALWTNHFMPRDSPYASPRLRTNGVRDIRGDLWSCAAMLRCFHSACPRENAPLLKCAAVLEGEQASLSQVLQENELFASSSAAGEDDGGEGPSFTLRTGARLRGGSGSYNGIMFDVVAKSTTVRITKVGFVADTNATATVTLYTRQGSFMGAESTTGAWQKVLERQDMLLSNNEESVLEGFEPLTVPAGARMGLFLHTTNGSGVLFYSENEGVLAAMGQVEEENSDIGITIGKKSESSQPFLGIQNQKRLLKGSITYTLITRSNGPRSSLIFSHDERATGPPGSPESSSTAGNTAGSAAAAWLGYAHAAESLRPVLVNTPRSSAALVPGLKLVTLEMDGHSLVTMRPGQLEWVPSADLTLARYPALPPAAATGAAVVEADEQAQGVVSHDYGGGGKRFGGSVLLDAAAAERLRELEEAIVVGRRARYYRATIRGRLHGVGWPVLRPLQCHKGRGVSAAGKWQTAAGHEQADRQVNTATTTGTAATHHRHAQLWLSEPITRRCAVSVWAAAHSHTAVYVQFQRTAARPTDGDWPGSVDGVGEGEGDGACAAPPSPTSPATSAFASSGSTNPQRVNATESSGTVVLFFDPDQRCVTTTAGRLIPWPADATGEADGTHSSSGNRDNDQLLVARVVVREAVHGVWPVLRRQSGSVVETGGAREAAPPLDTLVVAVGAEGEAARSHAARLAAACDRAMAMGRVPVTMGGKAVSVDVAAATGTTAGAAFNAYISYHDCHDEGSGAGVAHAWTSVRVSDEVSVLRPSVGAVAQAGPAGTITCLASSATAAGRDNEQAAADPTGTVLLWLESLYGGPLRASVTPLGCVQGATAVVSPEVVNGSPDEPVVPVRAAPAYLVEAAPAGQWSSVMDELVFASRSPSLDVNGRVVTQVLYSSASKCVVLSPSFTTNDVQEVVLRVSCPRARQLKLGLEPAATPNDGVDVGFSVFDTVEDQLFGAPQQLETILRLRVDVGAKHAYVMSSTGSFTDAFRGRCGGISSASEVRLSMTLMSPGSSVEILSWRQCSAHADTAISVARLARIAECLGETAISTNVAPTVGSITRHSSRTAATTAAAGGRSPAAGASEAGESYGSGARAQGGVVGGPQGKAQSAAKQMEVLIVSYARLLLEKSLIAQDSARRAVQRQLHTLLSYTSLRASPAMATVLDREFRGSSYHLVAQSCAHLLAPSVQQTPTGVEASVNVLLYAMESETVKRTLSSALGPSLVLSLLRTATVYTRSTRHTALRCAQELLSNKRVPLPAHALLVEHLSPLLRMMTGLCQRGKTSSAVVQIGVTLVADLISRYQSTRPGVQAPGMRANIPFPVVICARAVIDAITHNPPLPLPAALTKEQVQTHRIMAELVTHAPASAQASSPTFASFTETNRELATAKSFEVLVSGPRRGPIVVGWELESASSGTPLDASSANVEEHQTATATATAAASQQPTIAAPAAAIVAAATADPNVVPLPSCGYFIEVHTGKVFVCLGRKREEQPLKVKVKSGDVIVVTCSYTEQVVQLVIRRNANRELTTSFKPTPEERLAMPFFFVQHHMDAEPSFKDLMYGSTNLNVGQMYAALQESPEERDTVEPQSYDFYTELNLFAQVELGREKSLRAATETVGTHEVAGYAHLSSFLGAGAFQDQIPLAPLVPYLKRQQLFDALTAAFSPLINLQRKSELFDIFRVLKNLCAKETEEKIQGEVMRPFHNRQGRKAHVTIHTMQAQPSATLGAYQTLIRSIFGQLYLQLQRSGVDTFFISPIFAVKLAGFGSTDAGGPYRDVLSQLATEIMTTHPGSQFQLNPLFLQCGRGGANAIMPNPNFMGSYPLMLEFFGKLLASFFVTTDVLAVEFPPLFWKLLLGEKTSLKDLTALDPDIARELAPEELMERTDEELEERFPGIGEVWRGIAVDSPQLGLDPVLPPTTAEAAQLLSDRIVESEINRFAEAIECIQQGFQMVIPLYTLQAFRWQKVELLICGTAKLSYEAFRNECDLQLPTEEEAATFLNMLKEMSDEDRTLLLRFTTGQSRLPLKSRIKVQHNGSKNALPTSSTCFFTLRLPSYSSEDMMRERLLYAIRQCKAIDADGQARENLILDA